MLLSGWDLATQRVPMTFIRVYTPPLHMYSNTRAGASLCATQALHRRET